MSFYGGTGVIHVVNIAGCWETGVKEMNAWIKNSGLYAAGGVKGPGWWPRGGWRRCCQRRAAAPAVEPVPDADGHTPHYHYHCCCH